MMIIHMKNFISLLAFSSLLFVVTIPAMAQVPETIGYQGVLTATDGSPLSDGDYSLTFSLYETATEGTTIWTENQTVSVVSGVFSTLLGQTESLSTIPFDKPYWLGIAFESDTEMTPRIALAAAPYALSTRTGSSGGDGLSLPFDGEVDDTFGFTVTNASGVALRGVTNGAGPAVQGIAPNDGIGFFGSALGSGTAMVGVNEGSGVAGSFIITGENNSSNALSANTSGTGNASSFVHFGTEGSAGVFNNTDANNSSAALYVTSSTNILAAPTLLVEPEGRGAGGVFEISNLNNGSPALASTHRGNGVAVQGSTIGSGFNAVGVWAQASNGSDGLPLRVTQNGSGSDIALFQFAGTNVARIDQTGRGFFNGGTQNSGADVAELFAVEGLPTAYEPGDVLSISVTEDRTVTRSSSPYSTLIAGVYATKPGLVLTERTIGESTDDLVPMGVVGVIPTKVSGENGTIQRGDLLVSSSIPGHAMKGTDTTRMLGAVIGKALEPFEGSGTGTIKVLVNVK